jgi:two-component system response regulator FixJ
MTGHVHIVDDDEAVRDSLLILVEAEGLRATTYASAGEFLAAADEAAEGCVVTDVRMPGMSGLDLLRTLGEGARKRFSVIVLTGEADVPMAVEALKSGAVDFIEKPYPAEEIISSIRYALARIAEELGRETRRSDSAQRIAGLSARERDVLDGLMQGLANKEIARDLGISHRTVEAYRARLMSKMEVDSLAELVRLALRVREDG